jgi:hypothetical protein
MAKKAAIPAALRAEIFARFDCCAACGTWDADECGHIVAESNGGAMIVDNFIRLCGSCNRAQASCSVAFAAFATLTESRALVQTRRAYWKKYLGASKIAKPYRPVA